MTSRNTLHRLRDMGRLFAQFGIGTQPIQFAWHVLKPSSRSASPLTFRLRALQGQPVTVRPGTSDLIVLYETFGAAYDAPPSFLPRDAALRIWDLGSNIGLTAAMYAAAFPNARITGVELDPDNAALARRNVATFRARCDVRSGAVWVEDGTIQYAMVAGGEHGAHVTDTLANTGARQASAPAWSLNTLLRDDVFVDFMKMDIEGAEERVLKENTQWADKVGCIKVECHTPYSPEEAKEDLRALGFAVTQDTAHWASVLGTRARL